MNQSIEKFGYWWLPNHATLEATRFFGKFSWDPYSGAALELLGLGLEDFARLIPGFGGECLIIGQLDSLPVVSIPNARMVVCSPTITGICRVRFQAPKFSRGQTSVPNIDEMSVTWLGAEMTGLSEWMGGSSIVLENFSGPEGGNVRYLPPHTEYFTTVNEFRISLVRRGRPVYETHDFTISDAFQVVIERDSAFTYKTAFELLEEFSYFLAFALDRPVIRESIHCSLAPVEELASGTVEIFDAKHDSIARSARRSGFEQDVIIPLFPVERSAVAFQRFHSIRVGNRTALDFFFSHLYSRGSFQNQMFADMVHGLEGLHRGLRGGTYVDQAHYDQEILPALRQGIPTGIDPSLRTSLRKRLEYENEYSLRRRLKDLARFHEAYAGPVIGNPNGFSESVTDLRNELAHATSAADGQPRSDRDYFLALHRTRLLYQLELLHQMSFDSAFLTEVIPRLKSSARVLQNLSPQEQNQPEQLGLLPKT